jgi:hypothetical protein
MDKVELRRCEENVSISRLTDESVCPTLMLKRLRFGGAGASAWQPIFSQLLTVAAPIRAARVSKRLLDTMANL